MGDQRKISRVVRDCGNSDCLMNGSLHGHFTDEEEAKPAPEPAAPEQPPPSDSDPTMGELD